MSSPELDTITLFSNDISSSLTINQISKELGKSYGFTNKYIKEFIDEGILSKKVVGPAILCSLNFSNEKTLGLLILSSIQKKAEGFQKITDKKKLEQIEKIKTAPFMRSIFYAGGKFFIITEDKANTSDYIAEYQKVSPQMLGSLVILDKNEFKLGFRNFNLKDTIIIEGYESFWRLISEMMS